MMHRITAVHFLLLMLNAGEHFRLHVVIHNFVISCFVICSIPLAMILRLRFLFAGILLVCLCEVSEAGKHNHKKHHHKKMHDGLLSADNNDPDE